MFLKNLLYPKQSPQYPYIVSVGGVENKTQAQWWKVDSGSIIIPINEQNQLPYVTLTLYYPFKHKIDLVFGYDKTDVPLYWPAIIPDEWIGRYTLTVDFTTNPIQTVNMNLWTEYIGPGTYDYIEVAKWERTDSGPRDTITGLCSLAGCDLTIPLDYGTEFPD